METQKNKCIFLCLRDGAHLRVFTQKNVIENFTGSGYRIIILTPNPDHPALKSHFAYPSIQLEKLNTGLLDHKLRSSRISAFFRVARRFIFADTSFEQIGMRRYTLAVFQSEHTGKAGLLGQLYYRAILFTARIASRYNIARQILLWVETTLCPFSGHSELYKKYKPSIVVVGSLGFLYDSLIMREAKKNGAKVAVAIKNWDLPTTRGISGCKPDYVLAWNAVMKNELVRYHDLKKDQITICGVSQWDSYFVDSVIRKKIRFFGDYGLNVEHKLIYFAMTTPTLYPDNFKIARLILDGIKSGCITHGAQLLVRLHPIYYSQTGVLAEGIREQVEELEHNYANSVAFSHPEIETDGALTLQSDVNQDHLKEILSYCDLMVTVYSTQIIEAALFDVPIVNAGLYNFTRVDIPISDYENWEHIRHFDGFDGMVNAHTEEQLFTFINSELNDPMARRGGRRRIAEQQIIKSHRGRSGAALASAIVDLA